MSALVALRGVSKSFGSTEAVTDLDLELKEGEFHTILGPSGCGKTTALRLIAGFERPERGSVWIDDEVVAGDGRMVAPERRRVGMVFQDFALFPHLDVAANVGYGREVRPGRVAELLSLVGLSGMEARFAHQLSGGQQQRVALARALAPEPRVILLDEPFSNLDAALRGRVREEVKGILEKAGATTLFVTHDQEEALSLSDRVSVMFAGRIVQTDTPSHLYREPGSAEIAAFLGEADFFPAEVSEGMAITRFGSFPTILTADAQVMVRPENVVISPQEDGPATVVGTQFFGHDQLVTVAFTDGLNLRVRLGPVPQFRPGERVSVKAEDGIVFPLLAQI